MTATLTAVGPALDDQGDDILSALTALGEAQRTLTIWAEHDVVEP